MEPGRRPANARCRKRTPCLLLIDGLIRSARQATPGANGEKSFVPVLLCGPSHTHQFLGTFGAPGNGDYRGDLCRAIAVISSYATPLGLSRASILVRLDGLYGDAAPLLDVLLAGLGVITRSRAYHLLDLPMVKQT